MFRFCLFLSLVALCVTPSRAEETGKARMGFSYGWITGGATTANVLRADFELANDAGIFIRGEVPWSYVQSSGANSWNWVWTDQWISIARERNLEPLVVVDTTPAWASGHAGEQWYPPTSDNYQAWSAFCTAVANRYTAVPYRVQYYEIWNEPNTTAFWKPAPSPTVYKELLAQAHDAIKAVNPNAIIITGGTAPAPTNGTTYAANDWLTALYNAGAQPYFDAVAHHPYGPDWAGQGIDSGPLHDPARDNSDPNYNSFLCVTQRVRDVMVAHGDSAKRIWATEIGVPTAGSNPHVSEATQAWWVNEYTDRWFAWPFTGPMFWYQIRDLNTADTTDREAHFGAVHTDYSEKPAMQALRDAANTTSPLSLNPVAHDLMECNMLQNVNGNWSTVNFMTTFTAPVVVATVDYCTNTIPVVVRMRNVTGSSFQIKLQNPVNDTPPAIDHVFWMAIESGVKFRLPNGAKIEAQRISSSESNRSMQPYQYLWNYANPVVFGQVMTTNGSDWSTFYSCSAAGADTAPTASSCYVGRHLGSNPNATRATETMGVIVVESTSGSYLGTKFAASVGNNVGGILDTPPTSFALGGFNGRAAVATQAGMNAIDGSWAYLFGKDSADPLDSGEINLALDEDPMHDRHATGGQVGYFAISSRGTLELTIEPPSTAGVRNWTAQQ